MTSDGQKPVVCVRFPPTLAATMRELAGQDGVIVSDWLRSLVVQEIIRRGGTVTCPACKRPFEAG